VRKFTLFSKKGWKHPTKVNESDWKSYWEIFNISEKPTVEIWSSHIQKWEFSYLLPEKRSRIHAYLFFLSLFFTGRSYRTYNLRRLEEGSFERTLKVLLPLSRNQNPWKVTSTLSKPFFLQSRLIKILRCPICVL
jgi:hypothetical protein